jgi:hypothetical protein
MSLVEQNNESKHGASNFFKWQDFICTLIQIDVK